MLPAGFVRINKKVSPPRFYRKTIIIKNKYVIAIFEGFQTFVCSVCHAFLFIGVVRNKESKKLRYVLVYLLIAQFQMLRAVVCYDCDSYHKNKFPPSEKQTAVKRARESFRGNRCVFFILTAVVSGAKIKLF